MKYTTIKHKPFLILQKNTDTHHKNTCNIFHQYNFKATVVHFVVPVDATHRPVEFFFSFACWDCMQLSSWRTTVSKFCFTTYEMDKSSCDLVDRNSDPLNVVLTNELRTVRFCVTSCSRVKRD